MKIERGFKAVAVMLTMYSLLWEEMGIDEWTMCVI